MSDLTFNIASGRLYGSVESYNVNVFAWSGGRGGTKTKGAAKGIIVNNPLLTSMKLKEHHGSNDYAGALPLGEYTLQADPNRENWIRLIPSHSNYMHKRDGFAIHGRGPRGSDGCIVPDNFETVTTLYKLAIKNKNIKLKVIAVGDIDYFINRLNEYGRIG